MENTYLVTNEEGNTLIVDPGCYEKFERDALTDHVKVSSLNPVAILNTHCHVDHVLGNAFLKEFYKVPLFIPKNEVESLKAVEAYGPSWGITGFQATEPDVLIDHEATFQIDGFDFKLIYAPGHSPGHLMFYFEKEKAIIGGDVIFRDSIGRTDLPGGDFDVLERNIKEKVYTLPEDVTIYPGHGPSTTVGYEKANNPFVRG